MLVLLDETMIHFQAFLRDGRRPRSPPGGGGVDEAMKAMAELTHKY